MAGQPKSFDPDWLDVQYNSRARIPQHPEIFERWRQAAALSREQSPCVLDIAYGDEPGETLDVFRTTRPDAPVLVFIHGGWWRSLDKADHSFVAPSFVHDGALVVLPNYALCPSVTIEAIALQATHALAWTYRHAAEYGGDPERIVIVGHSAGGHLAAMLLCCDWSRVGADLPERLVYAAVSISGLYDLEPLLHTPFVRDDLRLTPASVERLSVARFPAPANPLLAIAGALESEEFLRQNRLIREAWGVEAVPVCETIPGTNHLDVLHDLADPQGRSHRWVQGLLGLG